MVLAACAAATPEHERALSPSELNATPAIYDGQAISVTGYLILKPEAHVMYESQALNDEFREKIRSGSPDFDAKTYNKYCLTLLNVKFLQEHRSTFTGKTVTLTGHFKSRYLDGTIIDLGACPLLTALILDDDSVQAAYRRLTTQ